MRPLAWAPAERGWWRADTLNTVYEIALVSGGRYRATVWGRYWQAPIGGAFDTLEAAQAACEEHWRKANHES